MPASGTLAVALLFRMPPAPAPAQHLLLVQQQAQQTSLAAEAAAALLMVVFQLTASACL
jgi:hypothetical protein